MDNYYSVSEVAAILKVQPQTVRKWIKDTPERMAAVKIGRRLLIPRETIFKILNPMPPVVSSDEQAGQASVIPAGDVKTKTELEDYFKGK